MTEKIIEYLPFLIPIAIIQLALMLAAVIHIVTHENYRFGNRILWLVVALLFNIIGPVLYFIIGRSENGGDE